MSRKIRANCFLLLTALIWGAAFVAQSVGMEHIGPFTFNGVRSLIAGIALAPIVLLLNKKSGPAKVTDRGDGDKDVQVAGRSLSEENKNLLVGGICCGLVLCFASSVQQIGLLYTTAGKAGFITALYIIIVPFLGLFMKKRVGKIIWICVLIAGTGVYLLCITEGFSMQKGDFIMLFSALGFAMHIVTVDYFAPKTDSIKLSCIQFFVAALVSFIPMFIFESPTMSNILISWIPLLYVGVMSGAVGFTLQIIAQKDTTPAVTALLLSFESVFAVLAGFVILNELLSIREIIGCILMFAAIILVQLPAKPVKINKEK